MSPFTNLFRKFKKTRSVISQNNLAMAEKKAESSKISALACEHPSVDLFPYESNEPPLPKIGDYKVHEVGELIADQFEVIDRLEGSMAYVYLAYDRIQDMSFAIKQPKLTTLREPVSYGKILSAARVWSELGMHPHIANCYFIWDIANIPYIFVEYVEGSNLREWIRENRCEDLRLSMNLAIQVCHGMERAHERELIHGDLKPENILINKHGVVQITDFGIKSEEQPNLNVDVEPLNDEISISLDEMIGTIAYMSPEQLLNQSQRSDDVPDGVWYDSDIYSFGICLWEMILDRLPYTMVPSAEDMPDLQNLQIALPHSLISLLTHVVAFDRNERPQDFRVLRESLNSIYQELYRVQAPSFSIELPIVNRAHDLNNQGYFYTEQKKFSHARNCFEKAIEIFPTHLLAIYNLTLIKWRTGEINDEEALSQLKDCRNNSLVDIQLVDELIAQLQAECFDLIAAKTQLEDYPDRYESLFAGMDSGQSYCVRSLEGHSGWINCVAIIPDGSRGLSGSDDKTVRLWNLEIGECLHTLEGHTGRVKAVALTPDGDWGLSGGDDKQVRVWDLKTGKNLHILEGHESVVTSLAVSADGWLALSGSEDKTIKLWNLKSGNCVHTLHGHTSKVCAVALSPDATIGLSGSNDKTLRFWDLVAGQCIETTEKSVSCIQSVALTVDGRRGLYSTKDGTLCLWNREDKVYQYKLEKYLNSVESVALTADEQWALFVGRDSTLCLWELETGQTVHLTQGQQGHIISLALTPDGQRLLTGNQEKRVQLWELPLNHRYRASYRLAPHITLLESDRPDLLEQEAVTDIPSSTDTMVDYQEQAVAMEEASDAEVLNEQGASDLGDISESVTDIDAWTALHESWRKQDYSEDASIIQQYNQLLVQRRASNLLEIKRLNNLDGNNEAFFALSHTFNGHCGLTGNADATICLWDLQKGEILRTLEGHTATVNSVTMTSDGRLGLSASADATLRLWDLTTGECRLVLAESTAPYTSVDMTPDGHWAITGQRFGLVDDANLLSLWDLTTGKRVHASEGHRQQVRSVALSADGCWGLSGGADDVLRLWNLKTFEPVQNLTGHTNAINSVAMTPDCRWGLSGGHDRALRFWDLQAGTCLHELKGHSAPVRSVAMTADGHWGFSGDLEGLLILWNLVTGESIETLKWHTGYVTSVALACNGSLALSVSVDNTLVRWRLIWDLKQMATGL